MKIAWLTPLNVLALQPELTLARKRAAHSCSWVVNLSRALAARGDNELHLITESPLVTKSCTVRKDGIVYHILKSGIPFTNRGYPPWLNPEVLSGYRFNSNRLIRRLRQIQPDIVQAYGTENAFALAAVQSGLPALISMQGILNVILRDDNSTSAQILKFCEREVVSAGHFFDCRTLLDSGFVREHNPAAEIFTIHRAINPAFFKQEWREPGNRDLLFVGSVTERKGIEVLLAALPLVVREFPEVQVRIVGRCAPAYKKKVENIASAAGIRQRLHFLGHLTAEEIAAEHQHCRMLVFPSFFENSPNGVAEAMVSGLPVVASRVGGIPSMIEHEKTGLLTEPANASELAKAVCRLLADNATATALGSAAAEIARERHFPATVAEQVMEAYRRVLQHEKQVAV